MGQGGVEVGMGRREGERWEGSRGGERLGSGPERGRGGKGREGQEVGKVGVHVFTARK